MSNSQNADTLLADAEGFAVLVERFGNMAKSLDEMKSAMSHMATKEQVAQLVGRNEFQKLEWEIARMRDDAQKMESTLRAEIDRGSIKKLWNNFTSIVSGALAVLALVIALTGWKRGS
jgi:hypothetical protein